MSESEGLPLSLRLTAEMYLFRREEMLVLKRAGAVGRGIWYLPGGIVEPHEDPKDAAIRETLEETGLHAVGVELLRVWSYADPKDGHDVFHATYAATAGDGDVVISDEHSAARWMTPAAYCERFWNEATERAAPLWSDWMRKVRTNCAAAMAWQERKALR
jgi:ADP-ribose pyrophosphatase YjhB (NUDIX family)